MVDLARGCPRSRPRSRSDRQRDRPAKRDQSGVADALAHVLAELDILLVLDNCEHLVEAVAHAVGTLLRGCPHVRVLPTVESRWSSPARSPGASRRWMSRADAALPAVAALSQFDSVRLFLDRAQQVRPGFTVDDGNAPAIAAICSRLDGVPLAIELSAARCRSMSPAQIFDGLTDVFRLLTGSSRGVLPRQATLKASITWSHDLLTAPERVLFRRLPVFAEAARSMQPRRSAATMTWFRR